MKKTLALVLAAVMTAGMATVAFAADVEIYAEATPILGYNANDVTATTVEVATKDADGDYTLKAYSGVKDSFKPGDKFYIPVAMWEDHQFTDKNDNKVYDEGTDTDGAGKGKVDSAKDKVALVTEKEDIRNYRIYTDMKVGEVDVKPYIDFVKFDDAYAYAVVVEIPEEAGVKSVDLAGTVSIGRTSVKDTSTPATFNVGTSYGYNVEKLADGVADWAKVEVVDFDGIDGVEVLPFSGEMEFEVDVTGQGKLNLAWNNDFNKDFGAMYDYANIDFITFEHAPSFNKNGTVYLYLDEDVFIYEVTEDGAKEISGLKWDEDYEAWTFKTRTLKSYAISDVELTEKTVTEDDSSSSTTDGGKENPDTGR